MQAYTKCTEALRAQPMRQQGLAVFKGVTKCATASISTGGAYVWAGDIDLGQQTSHPVTIAGQQPWVPHQRQLQLQKTWRAKSAKVIMRVCWPCFGAPLSTHC